MMSSRCTDALKRGASILAMTLAAGGCAAKRETVFVAASDATVTARLELTNDGRAQRIVVYNASTVDITVTSVRLSDCENIKNRCEAVRLRIPIAPHRDRVVLVVNPLNQDQRYNFRYSWSWEATNSLPQIPK